MPYKKNIVHPALLKAVKAGHENGRTIEDLADEVGISEPRLASEQLAELIRLHNLILWDGMKYYRPRDAAEVMDFAVEHPLHFTAILHTWRLGYKIKLKLDEQKGRKNVGKRGT